MKRTYSTGSSFVAKFFIGTEIEKTPAQGMKTLFVVGLFDQYKVLELAQEHNCSHIYFGANQSFPRYELNSVFDWTPWETMINHCLKNHLWCTLDLDVSQIEGLLESVLLENRRFIPQISVKLPYINQLGYNATLKIDDKDFAATNPGVWCHNLQDLLGRDRFTDWDQYGKDEIIK